MELATKAITCKKIEDLPTIQEILAIDRGVELKIIFENEITSIREDIGENWKQELINFQVGIHLYEPLVSIHKLITEEEIQANQHFFEKCAQDYGILAKRLITVLASKLCVPITDFPLQTLNPYGNQGYKQGGKVGKWKYFFHGYHCHFYHQETKQEIEVPLTFGQEFGELAPYFFTKYIISTPEYQPLPICIYYEFADGNNILEKMLDLGLFEKINSNIETRTGVVVKERTKEVIKVYKMDDFIENVFFHQLTFWKRVQLKIKRLLRSK